MDVKPENDTPTARPTPHSGGPPPAVEKYGIRNDLEIDLLIERCGEVLGRDAQTKRLRT
jgi:hypothetical protein